MVENLKELEKLLKLCRKQGVTELSLGTVSFKLGEQPVKRNELEMVDEADILENFPDGPLSNEELAFFANGGTPEENPYRRLNEN